MRNHIVKCLLRLAAVTALMTYAYATVEDPKPVVRPIAVGSPQELASRMDCWQYGSHGIPTHVIFHTGGDWRIGGIGAVEKAFKQVFDGKDKGMTIYAFCK